MKKILIIIAFIIIVLIISRNKQNETIIIPTDSIRLRIISNSNSELDVNRKIELKNHLENYLFEIIKNCNDKNAVNIKIEENFEKINNEIYNFLKSDQYKLDYGQNYFPKKVYKGVIYDEGLYDSLVVTLGNGKGQNWWCVLFPPLCLLEENTNTTNIEYQLFVSRIINNFK